MRKANSFFTQIEKNYKNLIDFFIDYKISRRIFPKWPPGKARNSNMEHAPW